MDTESNRSGYRVELATPFALPEYRLASSDPPDAPGPLMVAFAATALLAALVTLASLPIEV